MDKSIVTEIFLLPLTAIKYTLEISIMTLSLTIKLICMIGKNQK